MKVPARDLAGMSLGIELVLSVLLTGAFGRWIDRKAHTEPVFLLLGVCLGAAAGFRQILRYTQRLDRLNRDDRGNTPREGPPTDPPPSDV
jgi:F0F1-type ATP synthase assembly protein I